MMEPIGRQHPRIFARVGVVGLQFRACSLGLTQRLLAILTRQLYSQFCCMHAKRGFSPNLFPLLLLDSPTR
jgi:hypothetical protein